jgi:putative membrane protein
MGSLESRRGARAALHSRARGRRETQQRSTGGIEMHRRILPPLVVAAFAAGACAPAVTTEPMGVQPAPMVHTQNMLADWTATYDAGIEGARFAVEHAHDPRVREFAQSTVTGYETSGRRLTELADRRQWQAQPGAHTAQLQTRYRESAEALRQYHGADFDRQYIDHQIALNRWMIDAIDRSYMVSARGQPDLEAELRTTREDALRRIAEAERIRELIAR